MEVSFGNPSGLSTTPVETQTTNVPTPAPGVTVPAVSTASVPAAPGRKMLLGDKLPGFSDVILPRLNLSQNIGKLQESFPPGALVFNQQTVLFVPPLINKKTGNVERAPMPPITIYVLGIVSERFAEKIEGVGGGIIVNTEDDVRANGGTLDYNEWKLKKKDGMKLFQNLVDLLIAIEKPESVQDPDGAIFTFPAAGSQFALALWALKGGSYTAAMKRVLSYNRLCGCLREGGYPSWAFTVASREESYATGNKAWVPVVTPKAKTSPEMLQFIRSIIDPAGE